MELIVLENEVKAFPNQKEPNQKEPNQKEKEKGSNPLFLNRYQPKYFNDFETDSEMIDILNTLISINNLNVLFIGDIGCGKTAFLNASIREYYKGIPETKFNDNILHINSLKEQGINYYRNDVKIFCQTCSSVIGKKKIIVLDDIDLINEQSQQVFRNCIDKYSHNVHFIGSCSNSQKVIESLQSRLIIIKIKPLQRENLETIMHKIKASENIVISYSAEQFVLNVSNNIAKVLINYLEKFKLLNMDITLELATNVCTNISFFLFEEYLQLLFDKKLNSAILLLFSIYDKGYSVMDILDNFFLFIKTTNMVTETQKYSIIPLICKYITIFHNVHEDEIELALFTNNIHLFILSYTFSL
jgi:DNA polymerase III delta prime subunit